MYTRRGYLQAMRTQIDHGIFDYCGAPVLSSNMLSITDADTTGELLVEARRIGTQISVGEASRAAA